MKKLMSLIALLALLWGIAKFWPTREEPEGRVVVSVNTRRKKIRRPRTRTRRPATQGPHPSPQPQPRRTPRAEEVPVGV